MWMEDFLQRTLRKYCGDMPLNMSFALGAKVQTLHFQRIIVCSFSDARSVVPCNQFAPVQQRSPSINMADLSLNEGKDKVVADISPFDPTEKKKKKKQKKQKKQERVGEDGPRLVLKITNNYPWQRSMQGYALQML
ncbi:eukaryotic translation initiation factor 2 subunit beta-like isoform X2 [Prunus avium]|nr:eukaryotic translation initiation factor 2 subunit beta-like isoform X2 [Prunus avium]